MAFRRLLIQFQLRFEALVVRILGSTEILDHDDLYRGIHPNWVKDDGEVSSGAFDGEEMSVDLAKKTSIKRSWRRFKRTNGGLVAFAAEIARRNSQEVRHWPLLTNLAHSLVIGKKTKSVRRQLG